MSDVITPQNSDDVLTLIRRLVTEAPAPLVLEHPVAAAEQAADPVPLLVLTPALRVEEGEGDAPEAVSQGYLDRLYTIEPLLLVEPILPEPPQDLSDAAASAMLADFQDEPISAPMSASITDRAEDLGVDPQELRALVRDLIREELAGSLGTRMTRNIRKLVRAEIARELAMDAPE